MRTSSVISLFDALLTRSCKNVHLCHAMSVGMQVLLEQKRQRPQEEALRTYSALLPITPTSRTTVLSAQRLVWRMRSSWRWTADKDQLLYGWILWLTLSWFFCSVLKTIIRSDWKVHVLEYQRSHLKLYLKIVLLLTLVMSTLTETRSVAEWIAFVSMCNYSPFAPFITIVYCF
jgi:hypothetical protein